MISIDSPHISQKSHMDILIKRYITIPTAPDNIQYLRRTLRSGNKEGIKISPLLLFQLESQ